MISFFDLIFIILILIWMAYRMYIASELYRNMISGVYENPQNGAAIIFIEGSIYLAAVLILFPFGKKVQGWFYVIWYVAVILAIWCFVHVFKYFWIKKNEKPDQE